MSEDGGGPEPLNLADLNGAVLVYEDRDGNEVRVEFDGDTEGDHAGGGD